MLREDYEIGPIRPPDEADSLLIRTTRGCPWNRCAFCTLYKGFDFSIRPVTDIKQDIYAAKERYGNQSVEKCFLQDGDSFTMDTSDLVDVLKTLKETFPSLKQISSYGRAQTMNKKSATELQEIGDAGLNMLYCGMESGSQAVLKKVHKGITVRALLDSTLRAKDAGMGILLFTILGLGGKELSTEHANDTAKLINAIDPTDIRVLSLAVKPGTHLDTMLQAGDFTPLSEVEMIQEQKAILSQLDGISSQYGNYHAVNLLQELQGELPQDKSKLLATIDRFLTLPTEQQRNYVYGRRRGYYGRLHHMQQSKTYTAVQAEIDLINPLPSQKFETYYHDCRKQWI